MRYYLKNMDMRVVKYGNIFCGKKCVFTAAVMVYLPDMISWRKVLDLQGKANAYLHRNYGTAC